MKPKIIPLYVADMGDGSLGLVTEQGEILGGQIGLSVDSEPGSPATVTVEFVIDGKEVKTSGSGILPGDISEAFHARQERFKDQLKALAAQPWPPNTDQ